MNITDKFGVTSFYAQCVAAHTISILRDRICDKRWVLLASGLLNVSKSLLDKYIAHDAAGSDNILLANAILIVLRTVQTYSGADERHRRDILEASSKILETICELKIGETLPELQHGFCDLWNQLVQTTKTDECPHHVFVAKRTLKNIRKLYIDLHKTSGTPPTADGTTTGNPDSILDDPESYSMCSIDDHRSAQSIQDLQFVEPNPGVPPTPNVMSMPRPRLSSPPDRPPTSTAPFLSPSPAPYPTTPVASHYRAPFVDPYSYSAAPPPDDTRPFPEPQSTHSRASSVPRWGNVQLLLSPPFGSASPASSFQWGGASTQHP